MALDAFVGNFALNTSTGSQSVSGVGFEPKVIFFFTTRGTADGISTHAHRGIGAASSSTSEWQVSTGEEDGQASSDSAGGMDTDSCMKAFVYGTPSVEFECDFTTMDSDGFTFNISNAPGSAFRVGYLALGGADLTDVFLGNFQADNATGTQAVTGVGFQPDMVLFVASHEDDGVDTVENHANLMIGFATSATEFAASMISGQNAVTTMVDDRAQVTDACINIQQRNGSIVGKADLASFDSDGFTVDWSDAIDKFLTFVCLKGGQYFVGDLTTQTSTGNFAETGVGFQPVAGMFGSWCNPASGSPTTGSERSWGLATSSSERFIVGAAAEDGVDTSNVDQWQDDGLIYQNYDYSQSLEGSIDFVSWDSDGFTLNQIDADPTTGNEMIYLIMGSDTAAEAAPGPPVSTQVI